MQVDVLFFASVADAVGVRRLTIDLTSEATIGDVLNELESAYPKLKAYRKTLLAAVNEEYAGLARRVSDGDEIAFFPPVSGGEASADALRGPNRFYRITQDPIDAHEIGRHLLADSDGAICVFEGVVRNHSKGRATEYLVYEAYEPMALVKMEEIGELVGRTWEIGSVGIVHRLGRLEIGETSVAVVVTSPHRRSAFDACHYAIDRLKQIVPIWKKEYFEDGEVWVEGQG